MTQYTDYLIECGNPKAFDSTINQFGAMLQQNPNGTYTVHEGRYYLMRVLGNAGFIEFAVNNQGYGKIIRKINPDNPTAIG